MIVRTSRKAVQLPPATPARQFKERGWTATAVRDAIRIGRVTGVCLTADRCEVGPREHCPHGYPSILLAFFEI